MTPTWQQASPCGYARGSAVLPIQPSRSGTYIYSVRGGLIHYVWVFESGCVRVKYIGVGGRGSSIHEYIHRYI
jgi:hypothetical protein